MNQNFGFMSFLIPKIISGEKTLTNRVLTPFREKCNAEDIMHIFDGLRTKHCKKIIDAKVIYTVKWNAQTIPSKLNNSIYLSPLKNIDWITFSLMDGFETFNDFRSFFKGKGILKCFQFEIIQIIEKRYLDG